MKIFTKTLTHLFFLSLLVLMSYIQLNDPDPVYWVAFYGLCALVPALAMFNIGQRYFNWICIGFGLLTLALTSAGALEYLQHMATESLIQDMSIDKLYIEEAREFIGTLIALFVVTGYQWISYRKC